jgi:hypothetical protein
MRETAESPPNIERLWFLNSGMFVLSQQTLAGGMISQCFTNLHNLQLFTILTYAGLEAAGTVGFETNFT